MNAKTITLPLQQEGERASDFLVFSMPVATQASLSAAFRNTTSELKSNLESI